MNQITKLKEALSLRYNVDIDVFLGAYASGATRAEVERITGVTEFPVRTIASALNLRWPQKYRDNDVTLLQSRDDEDSTTLADQVIVLKEDLKQYEHELNTKERALVRTRREANRLRAGMRDESLEETVLHLIAENVEAVVTPTASTIPVKAVTPGVDFVVLSDLHAGATVSDEDVPDNMFNWEVMTERLQNLFMEAAANIKHDVLHVYMIGDMIDGLIHDSLEASDYSPAKSAKELASLLTSYILAFVPAYAEVHIYGLNGNHSRLTDRIKSNNKGFDFEYLMYSIMEAQLSDVVTHFEISTTGMIAAEVGPGVFVGLHHGDNFRGASNNQGRDLQILERFRQVGPEVAHLIQGHTHLYESHVLSTGGFAICNGSVIGTNAYVHTNGFIPVSSVQVIGNWNADGQLQTVKPIAL